MQHLRLVLIVCTSIIFTGCVSIGPPFFRAHAPINEDARWEIAVNQIGFVGNVAGKWWGERFFRVVVTVTNKSQKYAFLKMYEVELKEYNFNFVMRRNPDIGRLYAANPGQFDTDGFYKRYPGLDLQVEIGDPSKHPTAEFRGKPVFPRQKVGERELFSAVLVAGNFGIPMRGPIDRSENSTGWLAPGASRTLTMHYSVPAGGMPVRLSMPGRFQAELRQAAP